MHLLMKHRKKWGPHSLKWPQPISLSFSNMFENSVFYMQSKTAWWFWSFWHNVFYSSVSEETEICLPAFQWQKNGCWDFQLGGKNEMLQSVEAQSRESWRWDKNVSIHANWCPDPPPGSHCLLSGEGIKGPFTWHGDFHFFLAGLATSARMLSSLIPRRFWKRRPLKLGFIHKERDPVSLRSTRRYQSPQSQLVYQSREEGHVEFRARALTYGCRGTLMLAAGPQRPAFTGCKQVVSSWDWTKDIKNWTLVTVHWECH